MIRFLIILLIFLIINPAYALQKGGVQYSIPIDYSKIDETALKNESENLYNAYLQTEDIKHKEILLMKMLSNYSILGKIDEENPFYFTRLGLVYDKLGKDRLAKSNLHRAINIKNDYPYGHYCYGNYLYDRKSFLKALKEYLYAYKCGYNSDYDTLYRIGNIYEKLGDYKYAVKYYKQALVYKDLPEIRAKINELEILFENNPLYDMKKRQENQE